MTHTLQQSANSLALHLVQVPQSFDDRTSSDFIQQCTTELDSAEPGSRLILDFSRTDFIDSCGIGALTSLGKQVKANSIQLVAWSLCERVANALSISGCNRFIHIDERMQSLHNDCSSNRRSPLPVAHPSATNLAKRIVDICGASIGLLITAVLFIPIALLIKLDSPGPILFSQIRYGYLGQPIRIWKFRSMVRDAEARKKDVKNEIEGAFFKNKQDPRITRVGRFLRGTSLDELPQFWCVLIGSMSLVGTRPPLADEVDQYGIADWQRLNVKAGLTGEWQVRGRSLIETFGEVVALDRSYQDQWSLTHDFDLIWETVTHILSRRAGAV